MLICFNFWFFCELDYRDKVMLSTPATYIYQFIAVDRPIPPSPSESDMYAAARTLHCTNTIRLTKRRGESHQLRERKNTHRKRKHSFVFAYPTELISFLFFPNKLVLCLSMWITLLLEPSLMSMYVCMCVRTWFVRIILFYVLFFSLVPMERK